MSNEDFYNAISKAIVDLEEEKAVEFANKAINEDMNLIDVVEKGFAAGIRKVGELWEEGDFFLPELIRGASIMQNCLDLLMPYLKSKSEKISQGTVVIATIEGDIHTIGKTIVATMLKANGFEVIDLGADVKAETIVAEAEKHNADLIGVSALLTTTMMGQKKVIELLEQQGIRDKFKVMLGGAPVTSKWVEECKADGFASSAIEAVKLVKELLNKI